MCLYPLPGGCILWITLAILSATTIKRFGNEKEDLTSYWKLEETTHFSSWSTSLLFITSQKFDWQQKDDLTRWKCLMAPIPNIPEYRKHRWDLSTIWKTWFFQTNIEKSS